MLFRSRPVPFEKEITVGSAKGLPLRIAHWTVSAQHLRLWREGHHVRFEDLGSTNGTRVTHAFAERGLLALGASLFVGPAELQLVAPAAEPGRLVEFRGLVGAHESMRTLFTLIQAHAAQEASVLIQGETGTGKELVARALHLCSPRAKGPFVAVKDRKSVV